MSVGMIWPQTLNNSALGKNTQDQPSSRSVEILMTRIAWNLALYLAFLWVSITAPAQADSLKLVPTGTWGGKHIQLNVVETGAKVEYDCASGTIDEPLLLDKDDTFEAHGTHIFERGGPRQLGESPPKQHPAMYRGSLDGTQMRLTVTLLGSGKAVGTFLLGLGRSPQLEKCL